MRPPWPAVSPWLPPSWPHLRPLPLAGPLSGGGLEQDLSPTEYPGRPRLFDGAAVEPGDNRTSRGYGEPGRQPGRAGRVGRVGYPRRMGRAGRWAGIRRLAGV